MLGPFGKFKPVVAVMPATGSTVAWTFHKSQFREGGIEKADRQRDRLGADGGRDGSDAD